MLEQRRRSPAPGATIPWLFVAACLALIPSDGFAWAPATHLFYAKEALHFGALLKPALFELLSVFRADFLYGCIAADITLGKKFVEYVYNCHNFDVGLSLIDRAEGDAERAFAYGYVSHLAADTVSHNFFVPYQNVEHFDVPQFRHAYWEVRLDQLFGDRVWHEVEDVIKNPRTHSHDRFLDRTIKDTIFSFRTNKILFSSMLAVQRLRKWQQFVRGINRSSARQFNPEHLEQYNSLAVAAILRIFNEGKESCVYRNDPTGALVIDEAGKVRRELKRLKRNRRLTPAKHREACEDFRRTIIGRHFKEYPLEDPGFRPSIHLKLA